MQFDTSKIEFSSKDKIKGISLPKELSLELAEDIGIHIGDGCAAIYKTPTGNDHYYKCSGHQINEKEWYDNFAAPLKSRLFNLNLKCKYFCDGTYGFEFRSKAIVLFYRECIGVPLNKKSKIIGIPEVLKKAPLRFQIACLRGIFDTDFSITFKKKYKTRHYYPVITLETVSKQLIGDISNLLDKLGFNHSICKHEGFDSRINKSFLQYRLAISGKKNLHRWFQVIGSNKANNITKFKIWNQFGFCPPNIDLPVRNKILAGEINPKQFE
jgi:intein/homing endonuclease